MKKIRFIIPTILSFLILVQCTKQKDKNSFSENIKTIDKVEIKNASPNEIDVISLSIHDNMSKIHLISSSVSDTIIYSNTLISNIKGSDQRVSSLVFATKDTDTQVAYLLLKTYNNEARPFLMKIVKNQSIEIYDLDADKVITTTFFNYSTKTDIKYYNMTPLSQATFADPCTGQNIMNCINDAYTSHGWASVWAWIQTAIIPATAAGILVACLASHACPASL